MGGARVLRRFSVMSAVRRTRPMFAGSGSLAGTSDDVISLNSARGTDTDPIPVLGAGHSDIAKPESEKVEVVTTIARLIREAGKAAASRPLCSEDAAARWWRTRTHEGQLSTTNAPSGFRPEWLVKTDCARRAMSVACQLAFKADFGGT